MTLQSPRVRSVCESRCDWLRRTIEAVLCELTRCWSVLASRCRRSSGPGGVVVLASCLSCLFVVTMVCNQERCLLQETGEHALIKHVWEGRFFCFSGVKGLQLMLIERSEASNG